MDIVEFEDFKKFILQDSKSIDVELNDILWDIETEQLRQWIVRFLTDWLIIARSLSHKRQNKVLWLIGGNPLFIGWWLESKFKFGLGERVELLAACKCVTLAIPQLFVLGEPMENGYFMWWDLLVKGIDDPEVASECLKILGELSLHVDGRVQMAALHGLGHLRHSGRPSVVNEYIRRHPECKNDEWILQP